MHAVPLPQLQVFVAVARHRSFTGAARDLGVSPSAVSQAVKHLEDQLGVVLLTRTTRSVAPTEAGERLLQSAAPALRQLVTSLTEISAQPGETVGRVRITVGQPGMQLVIAPVLPTFRARHPRVTVEVVLEERLVDIVAEGFDAGVRLSEVIERDMVQIRLTGEARFAVVAAPDYLARHGTPRRPEDLLRHECNSFRLASGAEYAWEFKRGRKNWRVPVRGGVVTNDSHLLATSAELGLGLSYVLEPMVAEQLRTGTLQRVLEAYTVSEPGFFLYYPSRAQASPSLRLFIDVAKEVLGRRDAK
jgi:DNA-binding transcriptional LysR family regulator